MSIGEALVISGLFWAQFIASLIAGEHLHEEVLLITSAVYLTIGLVLLLRSRDEAAALLRDGFRTPFDRLMGSGAS